MSHLAGYDNNSFFDSRGNTFLTAFLEKENTIKTFIKKDDKIPNLDGTIELLEKSRKVAIPVQVFQVQVKTLNKNYDNKNKNGNVSQYKYSADTKVFNIVKEHVTSDPVILFLVDTANEKIFWVYVSVEYVMKLGLKEEKNKTIYFNDTDSIGDIKSFYYRLQSIHEERVKMSKSLYDNIITSDYSKEQDDMLKKEWDYLDDVLTKKCRVAVEYLYPNTWKFGIAYQKGQKYDIIGIYQIKHAIGGQIIKQFSNKSDECFTVTTYKKDTLSIREAINKQICILLEKYYKLRHIPVKCLPNIVLEEIAFHFLNTLARSVEKVEDSKIEMSYYKDSEKVNNIRHYWNTLIRYSIKQNQLIIDKYANIPQVFSEVNPLGDMRNPNRRVRNTARQKFNDLLNEVKDENVELPYPLIFSEQFEYQLYGDTIQELERRGIKTVYRLWKPKNYKAMFEQQKNLGLNGIEQIERGYLREDIYANSDTLFHALADAYKYTCQAIWKEDTLSHVIKREYSITYDKTSRIPSYYCRIKENTDFVIQVNQYSVKQMKEFITDIKNKKIQNSETIKYGFLTTCTQSELPLYDNIHYLINREMWENCQISIHSISNKYIW